MPEKSESNSAVLEPTGSSGDLVSGAVRDGLMPGNQMYLSAVRCLSPIWRQHAFRRTVSQQSHFNRERVLKSLHLKHGSTAVGRLLERIESTRFFAVNLSLRSLEAVWRDGCLKSFWETGVTGMSLTEDARDELERLLGIRGSNEADVPHPIYGAVGFINGRDELFGPATSYGECHLRLKESTVRERAVFLYGDLGDTHLGQHGQRLFDFADVHVARAKAEIDRDASYVEMQLFGGVGVNDVAEAVIPGDLVDDRRIAALKAAYPHVTVTLT